MAKAAVAVVSRHGVSLRLARQCGSQEEQRVQAIGSNLPVQSSSTKFANFVAKARWRVRRLGDWKEIAKLKAKYSILDLPLHAFPAAVSFAATLFAWIFMAPTDGAFNSCRSAQTLFFFLLNECSSSQNECVWQLQTNFYRMFGRFVSALVKPMNFSTWFILFNSWSSLKCRMNDSKISCWNILTLWPFSHRPTHLQLCILLFRQSQSLEHCIDWGISSTVVQKSQARGHFYSLWSCTSLDFFFFFFFFFFYPVALHSNW